MNYFITGIGTDVGKTVCSAIICKALGTAYWKPVQAGDLNLTDSMKVKVLSPQTIIFPERYRLQMAASPHTAAEAENKLIRVDDFELPESKNNLLIEGAGGLLVPINSEGLLYADLAANWHIPFILVSRNYLGSINHTLLSLSYLHTKGIKVKLIVFTGDSNPSGEQLIQRLYPEIAVHHIPWSENLNMEFVDQQARRFPIELFRDGNHE